MNNQNICSHILPIFNENQLYPAQGNLYLSGVVALTDSNYIETKKINSVLTIIDQYSYNINSVKTLLQIFNVKNHLWIQLQDDQSADILPHLQQCIQFIKNGLKNGNVLVHCQGGVSRSASVVIAFLIKEKGICLIESLIFVKERRKNVSPNARFLQDLKKYESQARINMQKLQ